MSKPRIVEGDDQPNVKNNEDIVIGDVLDLLDSKT
jgi:hypothetical protein